MYLSIFLHGFVKVVTWIWFLCISRPLPNKTKLKFDQDFKACWSSCLELGRWMSQSAQCLGSGVLLAMILSFFAQWNIYQVQRYQFPWKCTMQKFWFVFSDIVVNILNYLLRTTQTIWRRKNLEMFHLKSIFYNWSLKSAPWWKGHLAKY